MSNIQTGAERMPHDLSHLGFLAGQIGRLITISTTPVIAGDSFEMDAVGALRRSEERFSRNAETDLVCRLLLEKKNRRADAIGLTTGKLSAYPRWCSHVRREHEKGRWPSITERN